jgi:hypothetical protein
VADMVWSLSNGNAEAGHGGIEAGDMLF